MARSDAQDMDMAFQCYAAECLNQIMGAVSGNMLKPWRDIVMPEYEPEEQGNPEEIAADIIRRIAEKKDGE